MKLNPLLNIVLRILRFLRIELHIRFFRHLTHDQSIVPKDFDWKGYLNYNFDLRRAGLQSKRGAIRHYARQGRFEKRIFRQQDKTLLFKHEETRLRQLKTISLFNKQHYRVIQNDCYDRPITVSVIITLYNYAAFIDACLKSVLNNTLKDIEVIIVNDCSTDDSLSRCQAFLPCNIPITIIDKQANTGLVHSRNHGIQQAKGDFVFILDADNEIYPRCLENHLNTMRSNKSLIACYAAIDMFDESGSFCGQNSNSPFNFKKLHNGNYIDAMAMFNRQQLIAIGAYDEHLLEQGIGYEDYELWLRIGQQEKPVGFIKQPLSRYLKKQESMLSVANNYYHNRIMYFLSRNYFNENPCGKKIVVLIVGMHRSGTSALASLIGRMGADLGPDLIGPKASNPKGHFEPRKIVLANEDLLKRLKACNPQSDDLPDDWLEREETKIAKAKIQEIILTDFSNQDLFAIKDPRLCLLLPLYYNLLEELGITVKTIVIHRASQEAIKSLIKREGMSPELGRKYYEKYIRALKANLNGIETISISFDHLIERPKSVIKQIAAFIPSLAVEQSNKSIQDIANCIDPALRHHNLNKKTH